MINDTNQMEDIPEEEMSQPEMPTMPQASSMFDAVEEDKDMYLGNPQLAGQRSFRRAVAGIEDGDFQGLEQLDFGSINGTPAVSFMDEDGQRQVFKLTMPQWAGALEARSRGRKELQQRYQQEAVKKALMPQYRQILKSVPGAADPVGQQAWMELYDMDPETAYQLAGSSLKRDTQMGVLYGTQQPKQVVDAYNAMLGEQYKQRMQMMETQRQSTNDTNTLAYIGSVQSLVRPPQASWMPQGMTASEYAAASGTGTLPLVNAITMATLPRGIPGLPQPIVPPVPNARGEYNEQQLRRFAGEFNTGVVQPMLGWAPYDMGNESHRQELIEVLNHYNGIRSGSFAVQPPEPSRQPRPGYMRDEASATRTGTAGTAKKPQQAPEQTTESPIAANLENDIMQYGEIVWGEDFPNDNPPSDPNDAAVEYLRVLIRKHEENMSLKSKGKEPKKYPPPEVLERIYNAVMQKG